MKLLIIDDSILFRILLKNLVRDIADIEVCGTASDGAAGLVAIEQHQPDVVLLDVEMPKMTGLDVMKELSAKGNDVRVIMCSAFTVAGAEVTVKALELGAHDFITKPNGENKEESIKILKSQLTPALEELKLTLRKKDAKPLIRQEHPPPQRERVKKVFADVVGIGISTGGPKALASFLPKLPATFKVPIVIVQHMPKLFIESLANSLNDKCKLEVKVGRDGELLKSGTVYIAPGERQMGIIEKGGLKVIRIKDDPPENYCKPAADYLFRSLAKSYGSKALGIIMTGMGGDGAKGLLEMKNKGSYTIGQDEESSTIYGMPQEAAKLGAVTTVLSLDQIAPHLVRTLI
jgi:two-component system chemotaxis response regulator CheB